MSLHLTSRLSRFRSGVRSLSRSKCKSTKRGRIKDREFGQERKEEFKNKTLLKSE